MQTPSSLNQLGHAEKDVLILTQQEQVIKLEEQVKQLQGRLKLSSRNSSKPPSSDGLNKPVPKSLRVAGQKPTGGQKGHPGSTLSQSAKPDSIVIHGVPKQCQACQKELPAAYVVQARQVSQETKLPEPDFQATAATGVTSKPSAKARRLRAATLCNTAHARKRR